MEYFSHGRSPLAPLLASGRTKSFAAGTIVYESEDKPMQVGLVLEGFLRVFVAGANGRESTIRYVRAGDVVGLVAALAGPSATWVQALADSKILLIEADVLQRHARSDGQLAWYIANECARRASSLVREIAGSSFATVRQRMAHHLLSIARSLPSHPYLIAQVSQMELANAAGTVREVTVRELRTMREDGLIQVERGAITLVDPDRLEQIAAAAFNGI